MLGNNMRSRLIDIPRRGKVADGLSKLQGKPICQSEVESIRQSHDLLAEDFKIKQQEISVA